jgi:hypothetical protein
LYLLVPIERSFQFKASLIERYLVARYDEGAGHLRPHRDNTTSATSHRRFALTLNLNADEYEGGDLRFPEVGMRTYRASTGGAIVFFMLAIARGDARHSWASVRVSAVPL